jgi:hypothetical protein
VEGGISLGQFIFKSPLHTRIEAPLAVETSQDNQFRSSGTFRYPNYLGVNTAILIPIAIYLLFQYAYVRKKPITFTSLVFFICAGSGIVALALSFSRWAWISFLVGIILEIFLLRKRIAGHITLQKKRQLALYISIAFIIFLSSLPLTNRFKIINTIEGRIKILQSQIHLAGLYPLWGIGPGNSSINLSPYRFDFESYIFSLKVAHNTLVILAVETGIPTLSLFIGFIAYIFITSYRKRHVLVKNIFLLSFLMSIIIFLFSSLAYPLYTFDYSFEIFFIIVAMYLSSFSDYTKVQIP